LSDLLFFSELPVFYIVFTLLVSIENMSSSSSSQFGKSRRLRKAKGGRARAQPYQRNTLRDIPQLKTNVMFSHKYRFVSTSATLTNITSKGLLFASGCMGTVVNTTVTALANAVRLKHIRVWSPPASQGAATTCSIEFIMGGSSSFSNTLEVSDTSISTAIPACVSTAPPVGSLASFWQLPAAADNQLFAIIAPVGAVIDVSLDLVLNDGDSAAQTRAVATAIVGSTYYLALDNSTGHIYTPVSLNTTF